MSTDLQNAPDPAPSPDWMGWGKTTLTADQNQHAEAALQDALPFVCGADATRGASAMLPGVEAKIRSFFKFDGPGWDLMVAERLLYGLAPDQTLMIPQNMGNCVGDSHACLIASRIAHEVVALGEPEEALGKGQLSVPFIPYTYGVGRWVGGMLGPGDGSYCGAQIEGTETHGYLPCFTPGLETYGDLPQSSTSVGRLFGRSRSEIEKWTGKAKSFDLLEAPKCKTAAEAWDLIVTRQVPLQICSGTMPTFWKFDQKYGFPLYRMGTPASHSTQIVGAFEHKGGRFFVGRNQWGYNAHKGAPEIGIPGGCYVFPAEELSKWLPRAECIGLGAIKGLEANPGA
jgi:hypothetical protein